ncbi:hypothetical protein H6P81_003661 [Aristolochia fimbriata]|uniref:Uncharacterized protein n=1 Tax=Aristolochia fimbriata TaxID=158543 RepID=A0AAV7FHB7_ARIFI|nr:hypothetical protein H6P81_003661 [Aristolochia fimbriata]
MFPTLCTSQSDVHSSRPSKTVHMKTENSAILVLQLFFVAEFEKETNHKLLLNSRASFTGRSCVLLRPRDIWL